MNRRNVTSMFGFNICGAILILCWASASANAQEADGQKHSGDLNAATDVAADTNAVAALPVAEGAVGQLGATNVTEIGAVEQVSTNIDVTLEVPNMAPSPPTNLRIPSIH